MSLAGMQMLQHICCGSRSSGAAAEATVSNNAPDLAAAGSGAANVAAAPAAGPHSHPARRACRPVTLREVMFDRGRRVIRPVAFDEAPAAVKKPPTREQLLAELARRVAAGEDVTEIVVAVKRLPTKRT